MREVVLEHYYVLRSVLRRKPHLWSYLVRCRHCRIFFLTDPRNTGRTDLRCPFGCKQAHRKKESKERSTAYYQTESGKMKKKHQNNKRSKTSDPNRDSQGKEEREKPEASVERCQPKTGEKREEPKASMERENPRAGVERDDSDLDLDEAEDVERDEDMVKHIQLQTSLIEGRAVSREETLDMLKRIVRQRSLASERRLDYVVRFVKEKKENPP